MDCSRATASSRLLVCSCCDFVGAAPPVFSACRVRSRAGSGARGVLVELRPEGRVFPWVPAAGVDGAFCPRAGRAAGEGGVGAGVWREGARSARAARCVSGRDNGNTDLPRSLEGRSTARIARPAVGARPVLPTAAVIPRVFFSICSSRSAMCSQNPSPAPVPPSEMSGGLPSKGKEKSLSGFICACRCRALRRRLPCVASQPPHAGPEPDSQGRTEDCPCPARH